jgi:Peptidase propeptide and YPEB domain
MSRIDNNNNQNRVKFKVSRNVLFGIIVGIITSIGITGISNISAQEMTPTTNATNATSQMSDKMKLNGTIDVHATIADALKSKVTTDIIGAIQAAQASVGANSVVKKAEMTHAHGYLVYEIKVVDENMKTYKVIVDPGNGQVLMQKEVKWYDEYKDKHKKMKYGDEERYDKYGGSGHDYKDDKYGGHGDDYDKEKMMMTKDKKY